MMALLFQQGVAGYHSTMGRIILNKWVALIDNIGDITSDNDDISDDSDDNIVMQFCNWRNNDVIEVFVALEFI